MAAPRFEKRVVAELDNSSACTMNTFLTAGDVNGDGRPDILVSGRSGRFVWIENRGDQTPWPVHLIDEVQNVECGGRCHDLTGNGRLDVLCGGDSRSTEIWWWENPGVPGQKWVKRAIAETGLTQFHDTIIGDLAGEGRPSLAFDNQRGGTTVYRVPLPADPTVSPWPGIERVAGGLVEDNPHREGGKQTEEGLAIGDVDGDRQNEIVCGTHWFKLVDGVWQGHKFATGYITTKIQIADIDGCGRNEILLSEGDPCVYGRAAGGKFSWFKAPAHPTAMWSEQVVEEGLKDAHSLQVADLCGNGHLDVFVAEIGTRDGFEEHPPKLLLFENDGACHFARHVLDVGTGTHESLLLDMDGDGRLDIVGRPLQGPEKWNVHVYLNRG